MVPYVFVGSLVFWKMRRRFAGVGVGVGGVIFLSFFVCFFICLFFGTFHVALEEEEDSRVGCGLDWDKEKILLLNELFGPAKLLPF